MIRVRRVYDRPEPSEGLRLLVDGLWPRGLSKEQARIDRWVRDAAPSLTLRMWFGHNPARWEEFRRRYFAELDSDPAVWATLLEAAHSADVTLLFGAKDVRYNNAVALKAYLEKKLGGER
jgi:uncharacterized protein YeaO (DUF488 family)